MKIVFVGIWIPYSKEHPFERLGSETVFYGTAKELAKQGHEVYLTGQFKDLGAIEYIADGGIHAINIQVPNLRDARLHRVVSSMFYSKYVANTIRALDPNVVSLNDRFSAYFPSALKTPQTFTTHLPDAMSFYKEFALKSNKLNYLAFYPKQLLEERVMRRSDRIIPLTETMSNYLKERGFSNTTIIPNAVDASRYANKGDLNYILFAGRLAPVKGTQYLIQAFSELDRNIDADLLIIGSGSDEARLKKTAASTNNADRIHFKPTVGKVELADYLSKCSLFVLPSLFETFGVVLLEAMASEKAVIASNISGPKDIIEQASNGFLFEKTNVVALRECMELCLLDKNISRRVGKNARRSVEEKYTFPKIAKQYLRVFDAIAQNA